MNPVVTFSPSFVVESAEDDARMPKFWSVSGFPIKRVGMRLGYSWNLYLLGKLVLDFVLSGQYVLTNRWVETSKRQKVTISFGSLSFGPVD